MKIRAGYVVCCLLAAALAAALAGAQNAPAKPAPPDISGRYSFLQEGEDIQVNMTGGKVDGYVTRYGSSESDRGTMLQHTFAKATLAGDKLSFTTQPVHAVWYEFTGKVERGPAKSKAEDGYYQLVGTLIEHIQKDGKDAGSRSRPVTFKLFAEEPEDAPRK